MRGAVAEPPTLGDLAAVTPLTSAGTAAWLCAIPCALLVLTAMLVVGPPLGHVVVPDGSHARFLPAFQPYVRPEPTEQGRFLIALSAPLLLSLATLLLARRRPRISQQAQSISVSLAEGAAVALVLACFVWQAHTLYGLDYVTPPAPVGWSYFSTATLLAAAAFALAASLALGHRTVHAGLRRLRRESSRRRAAAIGIAVVMTVIWLLHAINTDSSVANAPASLTFHLAFTLDEAFAVLNGLTPLVDFSAQYGSLLPWAGALAMLVFGKTLLVFTIAMSALTALALFALYDVLRRATRSATVALVLYLPVLATSLYRVRGTLLERDTFGTYFGMFPLRYAGPCLLAWLTARQLERRDGRVGTWPLWLVAGLVLINNLEFGLAATGASVAAFLWTTPLDRRTVLRLARALAVGLAGALVLVSLFTLLRAGVLPRLWRLTDYAQLYAREGFGMLPIREPLGVHVVIYLTYVAAIVTATVRATRNAANRVLTGMLAWSGVFGLGTGGYFVGRSHPEALIPSFSAWAFALALLTVVAVSNRVSAPAWRPSIAATLVLFGFGIAACSLAQTPLPWSQVSRLDAPFDPEANASGAEQPLLPEHRRDSQRFISSIADGPSRFVYRRGAPVAILTPMGHRTADAYGVVDIAPYTGANSMETEERVEATLDALREAGGNTAIVSRGVDPRIFDVLDRNGFAILTASGRLARISRTSVRNPALAVWQERVLTKWVDTRHLHPQALG